MLWKVFAQGSSLQTQFHARLKLVPKHLRRDVPVQEVKYTMSYNHRDILSYGRKYVECETAGELVSKPITDQSERKALLRCKSGEVKEFEAAGPDHH